ncbi:BTAD domain-containing putative transcriptional regulator [Kitasatospora sp. NPDC051170]|uniref:AfsR/SARP family transcriptional regulator n=1 Tax=Kitasatospora sp. NPDC051170 TaxID=3364056 RepID=UPI0037B6ECC0
MKYRVLGPLGVLDGDTAVTIGARKMEIALAALLLRANQIVSTRQLITEIWDESPPPRARSAVHVYISQLRKLLARPGQDNPIVTRPSGYLLLVRPGELDSRVFEGLVRQGRELMADRQREAACAVLDEALALWTGPVLDQLLNGPIVRGFVPPMEELHLECIEMRVEASLQLGRHREVVSSLYGLIADHPLHEVFYSQLMRALCSSDRRGDALRVYRTAWEVLDRELGLEPGPKLRELQRAVLVPGETGRLRVAV